MKKIGIILAIIIFILIVCVVLVNLFDVASDDNVTIYNEYVTAKKYHNVSMCHTDENCDLNTMKFKLLHSNFKNKKISKFIEKINNDTKSYYEIVQSSPTDENPVCLQLKDIYKYSAYIQTDYQIYTNNHLVSIAVNRELKDICTNESEILPYEVIVYDKEKKEFLSQNDLLKMIGYSEDNVMDIIRNSISDEMGADDETTNFDYQYSVFFNNDGEVILAFRFDDQNKFNYNKIMIG